jgi:hypothetical protein
MHSRHREMASMMEPGQRCLAEEREASREGKPGSDIWMGKCECAPQRRVVDGMVMAG